MPPRVVNVELNGPGADIVQGILDKAKEKKCEVTLPCDWICGQEFKNDQELKTCTQEEGIPDGWEGMDCGPKSIKLFEQKIKKAKTVVWNGPAGVTLPSTLSTLPRKLRIEPSRIISFFSFRCANRNFKETRMLLQRNFR